MQAAYDKVTIFLSAPAGAVLDGARRARAGALVARRASTEIDHREPERRRHAERIGFGDDAGLETLDENSEHLIRSCGSLAIVSGI